MDYIRKHEAWLIFFGSLLLFCYGLFGREFVGFETRFAVFAQEMLWHGASFFPTTYDHPYPDYPAGLPLLDTLFTLPFGRLTTLSAILPSAIASSLTLVLIYKIALPINREWARISVLLCLFTYEFFDAARSLTMDPLIMFACCWAFYLIYHKQAIHFAWLAIPLCFGFFIRGPIGLIMPSAVIIAFLFSHMEWKMLWRFSAQAFLLLIILMALLLGAAKLQGGSHFVHEVLIMQIFGRLEAPSHHDFFAYFTNSFVNFAISFELAIISVIFLFTSRKLQAKNHESLLLRSLLFWVLIILIGMSIPEVRKIRYVMPIIPALALLGGYLWPAASNQRAAQIVINIFYGLCLALPFVLILLTVATIVVIHLKSLTVSAHYFSAFCTLGLFAIGSGYILWHHPIDYAKRNSKKVIALGLASFLSAMIFVVKPIEVNLDRVKPFVNDVMMNLKPHQSISFFRVGQDSEPIQFKSAFPHADSIPLYFVDQIDLQNVGTLYITKASIFDALPDELKQKLDVALREKLGHREMVVFTVKTEMDLHA